MQPKKVQSRASQSTVLLCGGVIPDDWELLFLDALRFKPVETYAAKQARVALSVVRQRKKVDPAFVDAMEDAIAEAKDRILEDLFDRAMGGDDTKNHQFLINHWNPTKKDGSNNKDEIINMSFGKKRKKKDASS